MNRGQFSLWAIMIPAGATVLASAFGAWGMSSLRVGAIDTQVQIVKTTEELHYKELKESVGEMKGDIKTILKLLNENGTRK